MPPARIGYCWRGMDETTDHPPSETPGVNESTDDQIASLQAQNAELRARLDEHPPPVSGSGIRRFFGWVLAVVAVVLVVLSIVVGWAETTLLDTDRFVSTLSPLPQDEAVAAALSTRMGEAVVEALAVEDSIADALPAELALVAVPITDAVGGLVASTAQGIIRSDAFATAWSTAMRAAHSAVTVLVSGDGAVVAEEGTVAIDLDTIAEPVVSAVADRGFDIAALAGDDFTLGQIVLVESDALGWAQGAVRLLDALGWFTFLIAVAFIALAILVAPDRRRQTAILGFGASVGSVITLIVLRLSRRLTVGSSDDEVARSAGEAAWDLILRDLLSGLWAAVFIGIVVGLLAWLAGPSDRAGTVRRAAGHGIDRWRGEPREPTAVSRFFATWRRTIEWAVVGLGLVVLLVLPTISVATAILVVFVGAILIAVVEVFAGPRSTAAADARFGEEERVESRD